MAAQDPSSSTSFRTASSIKVTSLMSGALALLCFGGCVTKIPKGVVAAKNFDPLRFEGTWYELTRTNECGQAGLTRVTATYKRNSDGSWLVTDRAWSNAEGIWLGSERKASAGEHPASLKVKHAPPRNIVLIDSEHTMALMCSNSYKKFWIISKNPEPEPSRFDKMVTAAQELGFPVKEAIVIPTR
jgi:apolipoprotein D and lipocalin family protein